MQMGPPPDPEQMASMLENPNFASQLNEALSNPDIVEQMIRSNPMLQGSGAQQARQMLQNPEFRRMMTDPEMIRSINAMRGQNPGLFGPTGGLGGGGGTSAFPMPGAADGDATAQAGERGTAEQQQPQNAQQPPMNPFAMFGNPATGGATGANPFAALFPGGLGAMGGPNAAAGATPGGQTAGSTTTGTGSPHQPQQGQQQPAQNPFQAATQMLTQNPQLMQQMLSSMGSPPADPSNPTAQQQQPFNPFAALQAMGGLGALGGGAGGFGAGGMGSPPAPHDDRPPEDRYAEQLRQLNDMGFYEFERNVEALRRTGGSVQGAVEYLLTH